MFPNHTLTGDMIVLFIYKYTCIEVDRTLYILFLKTKILRLIVFQRLVLSPKHSKF
jgi:hypothetical protein